MLKLDWSLFWTIFNVLLIFILMKKFLFKPLKKMMAERTKAIQDQIDSAEGLKAEAETLKNQYEESLRSAQEESKDIVSSAKERAKVQYDSIIEKANEDAAQIVDRAGKAAQMDKEQILKGAQDEIMDLTMVAVSKVIGNGVSDDVNKKLMDDFLAEEESDK